MSMIDSVDATLAAIDDSDDSDDSKRLAAACELARTYARQLDQAAIVRVSADKALRAAEKTGEDALIEQVSALRAKLGERECVDRLGARLHALLVELQATPKSRPARTTPRTGGALAGLRAVK